MRILITGGGGFLGQALARRLARDGRLGESTVSELRLADIVSPPCPKADFPVVGLAGDISSMDDVGAWMGEGMDVVFHLAAVVSGEAEADFDKGYRVNLRGTRCLLEAARAGKTPPKIVFASSIAVFGPPYPDGPIPDEFQPCPATSYGVQKLAGELLVTDYARKGFIDGVSIRLPTITVRPGKPNKAASSFFSGILREPLAGQEAVCPVGRDVRHWVASPDAAVGFLIHAGTLDSSGFENRRAFTMPGLSVTVGEMVDALSSVAGPDTAALIRWEPDEAIGRIVAGWPRDFVASGARALGFTADSSMTSIIEAHIAYQSGAVSK